MPLVTSPFILNINDSHYDLRYVAAWWVSQDDPTGDTIVARFTPLLDEDSTFTVSFPRDLFETQMQLALDARAP